MFAEDLSVFFDAETGFAVSAVLTPLGGAALPAADVLFDVNGGLAAQLGVEVQAPVLLVPTTTWPNVDEEDGVIIAGAVVGSGAYKVRNAYTPEDGAITLCVLART